MAKFMDNLKPLADMFACLQVLSLVKKACLRKIDFLEVKGIKKALKIFTCPYMDGRACVCLDKNVEYMLVV